MFPSRIDLAQEERSCTENSCNIDIIGRRKIGKENKKIVKVNQSGSTGCVCALSIVSVLYASEPHFCGVVEVGWCGVRCCVCGGNAVPMQT